MEPDKDELSPKERRMLQYKLEGGEPDVTNDELNYSLPEFLKIKEFQLAMSGEQFNEGTWRHQWLKKKKAQQRQLRNHSYNRSRNQNRRGKN